MKTPIAPDAPITNPDLLSAESLSKRLDCSLKHARSLIRKGILPRVVLGRRCVRTPAAAVDAFVARRTVTAQ